MNGRIEEAAGVLTGNDRLRAKGRTHQSVGHVKQAAEKDVRQARKSARKIMDRARNVVRKIVNKAKNRY